MVQQRRRKQGPSRSMGKETTRSKDLVHLVDHSQVEWPHAAFEASIGKVADTSCSQRHRSKFCGLAEMSGPWDPHARVPSFLEGAREAKGLIPIRWLVAKDVPFSAFDGIEYRRQSVCLLRHVNTIRNEHPPFLALRLLVRYF